MRAHNNIPRNFTQDIDNFSRREPWLQSQRIQAVIKASLLQRYQQIHYLYTQFYIANRDGLPIMRPMWMEFPTDTQTFELGNQFMWGDSFLVAPKLGEPVKFSAAMNGIYNITVYLPAEAEWYLQQNKQVIAGSSEMQNVLVGDLEYATFVKAGSIIPILNVGKDRMSIT